MHSRIECKLRSTFFLTFSNCQVNVKGIHLYMYISDHVYQCQLRSCSVLKFRSYTGVKQTKITTSSGKFIFIDHAHYIQDTPSLQSHTMLCSRTVASLSKHWSDVPVCVVIFALFIWVELIVTALYTNVNFLYQRFDSDATGIIVNQVSIHTY